MKKIKVYNNRRYRKSKEEKLLKKLFQIPINITKRDFNSNVSKKSIGRCLAI